MDKILKVAKVNVKDIKKKMITFYLIVVVILMFFANIGRYVDIFLPVIMDMLTFIFIILYMENTLKNKFNFSQSNNISRVTFIKGCIISIFPIAALMAVIDFALNRTMNLFIKAPTLYDLWFRNFEKIKDLNGSINWIQDGSINAIIGSVIFSFLAYSLASIIGLVIGVIRLRVGEKVEIIWGVVSVGFWIYWFSLDNKTKFFDKLEIPEDKRIYVILAIYILTFIISVYGCFKLVRKVQCIK